MAADKLGSPGGKSEQQRAPSSWTLAIHGGAGPLAARDYSVESEFLAECLRQGGRALAAGASALDVVANMVQLLEECGHHIAGRGAAPNRDGEFELDAAIMDGSTRRAGAVGALIGFRSPIQAARAVMERSPHVLLVGAGARQFAREQGLELIADAHGYYVPVVTQPLDSSALAHGTVGAVARDMEGRLAAATSTGGVIGKMPGRVGDVPLIGAGTWADERVAISCTGQGEYFMRAAVAADISARIRYGGQSLGQAAQGALDDMAHQGGDGGLIAVDRFGEVTCPFTSQAMKRGICRADGSFRVAIFERD